MKSVEHCRRQASALVHGINNQLCCIRLHASCLAKQPKLHHIALDIIAASDEIKFQVVRLAAMATHLATNTDSADAQARNPTSKFSTKITSNM